MVGANDMTNPAGLDLVVLQRLARVVAAHLRAGALQGVQSEQSLLDIVSASLTAGFTPEHSTPSRHAAMSLRTLRKVHEFVRERLTEDFSVDDIARAACMSPWHLGRIYHQTTGQSLWQYVLQCRAQLASRLIASRPETSLSDIAGLCGFASYSQFISAFRKTHGVTPGEFRRTLH